MSLTSSVKKLLDQFFLSVFSCTFELRDPLFYILTAPGGKYQREGQYPVQETAGQIMRILLAYCSHFKIGL